MEFAAIQYWSGVYAGNAEQISSVLDDNVQMTSFVVVDGKHQPAEPLSGKENVVATAMKMHEVIKSIENFNLRFHKLPENKLLVEYGQLLQLNIDVVSFSASTSESVQNRYMNSRGIQIWTGNDSTIQMLFSNCCVYESDEISNHLPKEEVAENRFHKISLPESETSSEPEEDKTPPRSCTIL
jgi:hypothetical protein